MLDNLQILRNFECGISVVNVVQISVIFIPALDIQMILFYITGKKLIHLSITQVSFSDESQYIGQLNLFVADQ